MSAWLLVGWFALYPSDLTTLGTFATQGECDARVIWLSEQRKHKRDQRHYQCLAVPSACEATRPDAQGVSSDGEGGVESLTLWGALQRAGDERALPVVRLAGVRS